MSSRKTPARRQRRHGDLPAGFAWREGRPRWIPSPTRRKAGWTATNLKDAWGAWLQLGPAIERARAIAAAVDAWAAGEPVPVDLAAIAPKGATAAGKAAGAGSPRAIRLLLDQYYETMGKPLGARRHALSPKTQADYKSKIERFLGVVRGRMPEARFMAEPIDILLPPAFGEPGENVLAAAYETLRDEAGESMASGCVAAVSAWMGWLVKHRRCWPKNPMQDVERSTPEGRIVVYEWPEIVALVRAAEARGLFSIADAVILSIDLSFSQQDLLALTWSAISDKGYVRHRRIKTGNAGSVPLLSLGRKRLAEIRARLEGANVRPAPGAPVLPCEMTGRPWVADTFRHEFAKIRADAAAELLRAWMEEHPGANDIPEMEILGKQWRDLRDASLSYCYEAGLTIPEICSRSLHAPTRAQAVIERHYGAIRQGIADAGATKLEAFFERQGYHLGETAEGGEG